MIKGLSVAEAKNLMSVASPYVDIAKAGLWHFPSFQQDLAEKDQGLPGSGV